MHMATFQSTQARITLSRKGQDYLEREGDVSHPNLCGEYNSILLLSDQLIIFAAIWALYFVQLDAGEVGDASPLGAQL